MKTVYGILAALMVLLPVQAFAQEAVGTVARAQFTSGILDREPVDEINSISTGTDKVYFFTEFQGMEGKTMVHRWKYMGEVKAELTFNIGSQRWRVYSSKNLIPEWTADWTVEIVDGDGNVMETKTLSHSDG